jgi:hypothetical protein
MWPDFASHEFMEQAADFFAGVGLEGFSDFNVLASDLKGHGRPSALRNAILPRASLPHGQRFRG